MKAKVNVRGYDGEEKEAQAISISADMTNGGDIFFITEVHGEKETAAVSFIYDIDEALEEFVKVARDMLRRQQAILQHIKENERGNT